MILPEIRSAGIYDSAIRAKNVRLSKKRKTAMFEIEIPLEKGGISYVDGAAHAISPNLLICAKPGQMRHTHFPFRCYFLHLRVEDEELRELLLSLPDFFETEREEEYRDLFSGIVSCHKSLSREENVLLQSLVLRLFYLLQKDSRSEAARRVCPEGATPVDRAISYVREDLSRDLSLEAISRLVSLSPVHFHGLFKRSVGMTLREYVEEQRLKKAVNLLLSTDFDLTRIAYECGFSSQSYFSFAFKRKMGVTPRDYVRRVFAQYEK